MIAKPARCQDWQSPDQVAQATHQIAVPAGTSSVVNTGTGKLITTIPIVGLSSRAKLSIDFVMTKVSHDGNLWSLSRPACGWRHSYQSWIAYSNVSIIKYQWNSPNGSYAWNGTSFTRGPGNPYDLSTITGGYQVRDKDGTIYEFTHQKGGSAYGYMYLTAIREPHGNQITLYYDNATYDDIVTRIVEPSGRYLQLDWKTDGTVRRLRNIWVKKPDNSLVRTYQFKYPDDYDPGDILEPTKLVRIIFPQPTVGAEAPFYAFDYSGMGGYGNGYGIHSITTSGNNTSDPDIVWNYTYDNNLRVTDATGPTANEGRGSTSPTVAHLRFHYPNNISIGGYSYRVCRVLDALYTGNTFSTGTEPNPADRQQREVHLYRHGSDDPYEDFGPLITYTIGPQSTDDASSGSTYDSAVTTAYPNCYYSKYLWNESGTEYDCTLKSYTDPGNHTYQYKWYDTTGGNTTTDSRLNLWKVTNPKNEITTLTYLPSTSSHKYMLSTVTDPGNHQAYYEYNSYHDIWKIHTDYTGLNLTEENTYDNTTGNLTLHKDAYGKQVSYQYDSTYQCFVWKETDVHTGIFSECGGFDVFGNKGWSRSPRSSSGPSLQTDYEYDNLGRLKEVTNPDTTYEQYTYDTNGNTLTARDANGEIVEYYYDNFGRVDQEKRYAQIGSTTNDTAVNTYYCYDELGQHKWTKWQRGGTDKYIRSYYDERNRLIKETMPGDKPGWFTYKYDGAGKTTQRSSGHGTSTVDRTWTFSYDELGRPHEDKRTYPTPTVTLADRYYTTDGLLWKIENSDGYNVQYDFDGAHRERFCTTTYPGGGQKTVEHAYAAPPSKTVTVNVRNGGTSGTIAGSYTYEYADNGKPTYLTSPTGAGSITTGYEYSTLTGLLTKVTYNTLAASPYTTFAYDTASHKRLWLTSLQNYRSDGSKISTFDYSFDEVGNHIQTTEANGDYTLYGYDASYNLRTEQRKNSSNNQIYKYEYQYDTAGNRTAKILTNSAPGSPKTFTCTYSDNNLLTQVSGGVTGSFSYDYFGNQSGRTIGSQVWTYAYDSLSRLTTVNQTSSPASTISSFKYDALGRRIERTDASGTIRYIHNGTSLVAEMDTSNNIVAWYTPGVCMSRYTGGTWKTFYYLNDALGSSRELTDDMQRVTDAYAYNAWGEDFGQLRATDDPDKPVNPLRFVGKERYYSDNATGLILLGARYYDPMIGRFITQDPIGDGLNWYVYSENDPVNGYDSSGLKDQRRRREARPTRDRTPRNRARGGDLDNLENDRYGAAILHRWAYGDGTPWVIYNDPDWSGYMMDNAILRESVATYLKRQAEGMMNGEIKPIQQHIHMEIENGEGIVGYHYLHGTNGTVGDFLVSGYISKHKNGDTAFVMTYGWNDVIDPNFDYDTDRLKAFLAPIAFPFSSREDYVIRISWMDRSVMNSKGKFVNGWFSRD